MKLTQFTDYSLRALMYLAIKQGQSSTVKEISDAFKISYNHMVKIVHTLSKRGYIEARKGKGGGILLAITAEEINLGNLVCTLEPDLDIVECFGVSNKCNIKYICKLKHVFADARKAFIDELKKYTLADITSNKQEFHTFISILKTEI